MPKQNFTCETQVIKIPPPEQNLAEGSVIKKLVMYAMPLVAGNLLQALYGMADMIIAGQIIGDTALSAINNASQITMLITNIALGLSLGGSILIGQYFGARNNKAMNEVAGTLFSLMIILGIFTSILLFTFGRSILMLLGAPSLDDATAYLNICAIGMVSIFGYNALSAILRAIGNSRQPFYFIAVAAILNILLDILFMGTFSMGTPGAALATIVAQTVAFATALAYVLCSSEILTFSLENLRIRRTILLQILRYGIPTMMQSIIASLSWLTVTSLINSYGMVISAGNGISIKVKEFCQLFTIAMASAATAIVAQNLGAGLFDRARKVTISAIKISMFMSIILIVLVELFAPQLARIFTPDDAVIAAAVLNLRIEIIGQIFYAQFLVYHALAVGAGHTWFAMTSSFINCILFRVILAISLNRFFGLPGLYLACATAPSISVLLGWLYMRSNIWRRSLVKVVDTVETR